MDNLADVERLYRYIHSFFGEVRIDEYIVTYEPDAMAFIEITKSECESVLFKPILIIGDEFLAFSRDGQEGVLAHEIGHLVKMQSQKIEEVISDGKEDDQLDFLFAMSEELGLGDKEAAVFEGLKKKYINKELFADYMAFKKGFGLGLLEVLRGVLVEKDLGAQLAVDWLTVRIEHLEKRLEDKK